MISYKRNIMSYKQRRLILKSLHNSCWMHIRLNLLISKAVIQLFNNITIEVRVIIIYYEWSSDKYLVWSYCLYSAVYTLTDSKLFVDVLLILLLWLCYVTVNVINDIIQVHVQGHDVKSGKRCLLHTPGNVTTY